VARTAGEVTGVTVFRLSPASLTAALRAAELPPRSFIERLRDWVVHSTAGDPFAGVGLDWERGLPDIGDESVLPEFRR
jgi:hypothetical protein